MTGSKRPAGILLPANGVRTSVPVEGSAVGPSGEQVLGPITITGTATVLDTSEVTLASGDNTVNVPAGAVAVAIVLPIGSSVALTVRTSLNSGDAGLPIAPGVALNAGPVAFVYPFPTTAPTTVIIHAATSGAGVAELTFI